MHIRAAVMNRILFLLFFIPSISGAQSLETIIQKGHELAVTALAVSPDNNYVATGSRDKSAKLWELSTGREVRNFLGHEATVNSVDFSSDGKYLITGGNDATAKIWEIATGKTLLSILLSDELFQKFDRANEERINDVAFDPKGKFFVTLGQMVRVWEFPTQKRIKEWLVESGNTGAQSVAISPDGQWMAVGKNDAIVTVYRTDTWNQVYKFESLAYGFCGGCPTEISFSPDSRYLLKGTKREIVKYELASGKLALHYNKHIEDISSVAFSRNGNRAVVSTRNEIILYDASKGDSITTFKPDIGAEINQVTFAANDSSLLLACNNNIVVILDSKTGKKKGELTGILNQRDRGGILYDPNSYWDSYIAKYIRFKNSLLLSPDHKTLLKGKFGNKLKRWNLATGKTEMIYTGHEKTPLCYQYSRDGKKLLTGGGDGIIILWNAENGDTIFTIKSYREPVLDVHFSSDETQILSSSWDATLKIHDAATGKRLHLFDLKNGSAYHSQFSRNDLYVFTATLPTGLQMREIDTQKIVREFEGHTETISSLQISKDGKNLLTSSWDGSIRLWDVATALAEKKFAAHAGPVHIAIFNTSESNIFSGGADRVIRQWDVATGKVMRTFEGHLAEITSLQITADEKLLISHSLDGVTKFWDLTTGKEFFEHILVGENDWMVKNTEGYFSGTGGARKHIHFVDGLRTYAVDQFFNEFYRPDLLPQLFQNRGSQKKENIQGRLLSSPPPTVRVAVLPGSDPAHAEVFVKLTDHGAGVTHLKLFHNGKSVPLVAEELKLPKGKNQSTTYRHTFTLVGGTNTFSASASNEDKIESDPHSVEYYADVSTKSSTCYILSVGINQYKNPRMSLNYARPDAESFTHQMEQNGQQLFKKVELHTLFDQDASRAGILKKLDELSQKIHQEDVFIFYYAGHGSMVDNQFYFIPTESVKLYDPSSLEKDALEAGALQEKFKNIKALKQLIVMDACQSGGSVELLATRGAAEEKAIAQLSRSAGIHVMASAGSEQFATEFAELGHGLFTYVLLKGLQGEADGAPKDGKVTIYELKSYLDDQVPEMTRKLKGKPQYPYTFSRGQDFPVVIEE